MSAIAALKKRLAEEQAAAAAKREPTSPTNAEGTYHCKSVRQCGKMCVCVCTCVCTRARVYDVCMCDRWCNDAEEAERGRDGTQAAHGLQPRHDDTRQ